MFILIFLFNSELGKQPKNFKTIGSHQPFMRNSLSPKLSSINYYYYYIIHYVTAFTHISHFDFLFTFIIINWNIAILIREQHLYSMHLLYIHVYINFFVHSPSS